MPPRRSAVGREIKQMQPFASPTAEGVVALLRTASIVERTLSRAVEPMGITLAQYNVLRILRGAGAEGLPTLAIRDRLVQEAPGITRLLDKLERAGHVRRERSSPDRRQVICHITAQGLALLRRLDAPVLEAGDAALAALDRAGLRQLVSLLDQVRAG